MNSNGNKKCTTQTARGRRIKSEEDKPNWRVSKLTSSTPIKKKKLWAMKALMQSMKPSSEELKFREEKLKENNILLKNSKLFRCTKCLSSFNSLIEKHEKVPIHPILGVLMCQKCCNYYEDGEFSLDSDGEDKYCRWCGEGGTIFGCSKCISGFCATCIKKHFKSEFFKKVLKDDNWLCFFCNPEPLWPLRFICSQAVQASENTVSSQNFNTSSTECKDNSSDQSSSLENFLINNPLNSNSKSNRKRIYSSSSDESEHEAEEKLQKKSKLTSSSQDSSPNKMKAQSFENVKSNFLAEIEKVLKLSEYQLSFGATWTNKMLKKLGTSNSSVTKQNLANECQKIKWFLSLLSTYLVQFCNSLNSIEKNLLKDDGTKISSDSINKNESPYVTILQFLEFINKQVNTFIDRDINISDVLQAEVYDDENFIGIKKSLTSASCSSKGQSTDSKTNVIVNESEELESSEGNETQKTDNEGRDEVENSLDQIQVENHEMNSAECDKEHKGSYMTLGGDLKTSPPEEDIQEILAILENA